MLTQWCNASCASCYLGCTPSRQDDMTVAEALELWRQLTAASPHGCRVHLTGGEPFGCWESLIAVCRKAAAEGLGPLTNVETNAFWATDEQIVRDRLAALDAAGMQTFAISADPYHQQFVPIANARLAARVAEEVLGAARLKVRWRDWLTDGRDTGELTDRWRAELFSRYAGDGRDRMNGRAAAVLGPMIADKEVASLRGRPCAEALLRSKHVHIGAGGWIMPGVCAGMWFDRVGEGRTVGDCWERLNDDWADRGIVGVLAAHGPTGLLAEAERTGFAPAERYAGKCHLCWSLRRHFVTRHLHEDELGPIAVYDDRSET
jgi:hypothetical protein